MDSRGSQGTLGSEAYLAAGVRPAGEPVENLYKAVAPAPAGGSGLALVSSACCRAESQMWSGGGQARAGCQHLRVCPSLCPALLTSSSLTFSAQHQVRLCLERATEALGLEEKSTA